MVMHAYHFTEDLRQALAMAHAEAHRLQHGYVGTEHLALGLLSTARDALAALLAPLDRAAVTAELERRAGPGAAAASEGHLPYTSRSTRVLELAMTESVELGHPTVRPEHLLLGLLRDEQGVAGRVLRDSGLALEAARAMVVRDMSNRTEGARPSGLRRLLLRVLRWAGLLPRN